MQAKVIYRIVIFAVLFNLIDLALSQKTFKSVKRNTYYIEPEKKFNWFQATNECTLRNMTLLTIDSLEKNKEVTQLLNAVYKGQTQPVFYIGATDLGQFQKFVWISNGQTFDYTNWNENALATTDKLYDHCVVMGLMSNEKWNVVYCKRVYGFICEKKRG